MAKYTSEKGYSDGVGVIFDGLMYSDILSTSESKDKIVLSRGYVSIEFIGVGLDAGSHDNRWVSGTINEIRLVDVETGAVRLSIDGLTVSLSDLGALIDSGSSERVFSEFLFSGDDQFIGTSDYEIFRFISGNDTIDGGPAGGPNSLWFADHDLKNYVHGVEIDLALERGVGLDGGKLVLRNIDAVGGTNLNDTIRGDYRNNALIGFGGDDLLNGDGGADDLMGADGNDTLVGGFGHDTLYGGDGVDVAIFSGNRSDYEITFQDAQGLGPIEIRDRRGFDGVDMISQVEFFEFNGVRLTKEMLLTASVPNQKPVITGLSNDTVLENSFSGQIVGQVAAYDSDTGDKLTYRLLDDADGRFKLVDNVLQVANGAKIDYEVAKSHTVSVEVKDEAGAATTRSFTIKVSDVVNENVKGGSGSDKLYGGVGKDILTGGKGKDSFVFNTKASKANVDRVTDFNVKDDSIMLDKAAFAKLGKKGSISSPAKLNKDFFTLGAKAKDKNDYLVYDNKKGVLYYDADGSGKGKQVEIATFSNKAKLTADDFFVV